MLGPILGLACFVWQRWSVCTGSMHAWFFEIDVAATSPSSSIVQVQAYLEAYADKFKLREHISFGSAVSSVEPLPAQPNGNSSPHSWPKWAVDVQQGSQVRVRALLKG